MTTQWRLDDGHQTLVLAAIRDRLPQVVYWGSPLPLDENLETVAAGHAIDITGGMLDANPDLSICPEAVRTFPGQPGLICRDSDGTPLLPKFCFVDAKQTDGALELVYADSENRLTYCAHFQTDTHTGMITTWAELS